MEGETGKLLFIGRPAMAIGLGVEDVTKAKFIYLTKQKDGGNDLRPDSFKIKFFSKDDLIAFRLAVAELLRIWDLPEEKIAEEMIHPKEKTDHVRINETLANLKGQYENQ